MDAECTPRGNLKQMSDLYAENSKTFRSLIVQRDTQNQTEILNPVKMTILPKLSI